MFVSKRCSGVIKLISLLDFVRCSSKRSFNCFFTLCSFFNYAVNCIISWLINCTKLCTCSTYEWRAARHNRISGMLNPNRFNSFLVFAYSTLELILNKHETHLSVTCPSFLSSVIVFCVFESVDKKKV